MKRQSVLPFVLAGLALILFAVVLGLSGGTVLYEASDDAYSPSHKDVSAVSVMTTEEAETILPLMAEIMLQSSKISLEIDAKDFAYSERELQEYANLIKRLKSNNAKINLGNTELNDFRISAEELNIALEVLNSDVARMEEIKQEIRDGSVDASSLAALYSEMQALSKEITLTAETYSQTADKVIETAKKQDLDTSHMDQAVSTVNKVAANALSSLPSTPSDLPILFTISDDTFVYADTLEPWEEEFLEEYGEYWMYEDYGNQWFEYFLYEGNDEERYNELSLMYQNLAAQNAVPSNSVLEPWEERFLLEYGEDWMYEDLENFDKSWIYLNYGVNWFEYYLDEGEDELYNTLLQMYEEQKAQNTVPFKTSDISVDGSSNLSVQNTSNTTVLDSTNTSILNITNTTTLNTTNTTIQNLTNPSILNTTNTSSLNVTEKPDQNETVTPNQNPENGIPIVPIIVGTVIAVILVTGVVVLVLVNVLSLNLLIHQLEFRK